MINGNKVVVCDKSPADAADDYAWQTDPELAHLTATCPLTTPFPDYLSQYASQLQDNHPRKHQFAIKTRGGKHIGNCAYYNVDETMSETEIGIVIGDRRYWDRGYGTDAVTTLVSRVFSRTNLRRIHLKALDSNKRAQRCFYRCGFTICGSVVSEGNNFILMELLRSQWQQNKDKYPQSYQLISP